MSGITRRGFVKGAALAPLALTPLNAMARQTAATPDRFDIVVAGAGHNSLVTAAYLSKAGFRCVVLSDCCASYFPQFHEAGLAMIKAQGGIFGSVAASKPLLTSLAAVP